MFQRLLATADLLSLHHKFNPNEHGIQLLIFQMSKMVQIPQHLACLCHSELSMTMKTTAIIVPHHVSHCSPIFLTMLMEEPYNHLSLGVEPSARILDPCMADDKVSASEISASWAL